ncbi:hypothetical protein GIB67_007631 [Kingdonia uniflora]|uniref:Uncharacterized protein n=1 Tax=Kingdonia uniflora TaxID=39325 RepID=A0A7J7N1T6_9MAGN|nr:hypothetical protein GIB67_007631 [Kingdonia uniflora]
MLDRAVMQRAVSLIKHSIAQVRSFSVASSPNPTAAVAAVSTEVKPKKKRPKNLFDVAKNLPDWGIGYRMAKKHWVGVSYEITKINLYKNGCHGKAWGIIHKEGRPPADTPKKISGVHKRCWKYIKNSKKTEAIESTPKPENLKISEEIESTPKPEAQVA